MAKQSFCGACAILLLTTIVATPGIIRGAQRDVDVRQ